MLHIIMCTYVFRNQEMIVLVLYLYAVSLNLVKYNKFKPIYYNDNNNNNIYIEGHG